MHNNNNYQCKKMCWNKALTFDVSFWCWFDKTKFSYHCVHPIHANMFSIQILLHFSQIAPRVCTLVLFIIIVVHVVISNNKYMQKARESENDAGFLSDSSACSQLNYILLENTTVLGE